MGVCLVERTAKTKTKTVYKRVYTTVVSNNYINVCLLHVMTRPSKTSQTDENTLIVADTFTHLRAVATDRCKLSLRRAWS